ncbi:putative uncharacterized protein DDB_G0284213 [Drosophila mojavensis]|uniref:Uncharacterized protein n=1 Tax=Drosophila mojavensis TaxID=7230 RepID=B4KFR6_DROMO|nr:putative uncharacterized protein DDB_G0284213 [Drosophila mojavensis]EDW11031.2 uncharacterized protein Dmoj_GI16563 [Drosophila mojavensis]
MMHQTQNQKQSKMLTANQLLGVAAAPAPLMTPTGSYNGNSTSPNGSFVPEIKAEQLLYEMDSTRSCPSAASSYNNYSYFPASPSSRCSTADSYAPGQQQQQQQHQDQLLQLLNQQQDNLNVTISVNNNASNWNTTTLFNGGSITPTNLNNGYNSNSNSNSNNNNNNVYSAISPAAYQTNFMTAPQAVKAPQLLVQPPPPTPAQPQQQPDENPSLSDLIMSSTLMDYTAIEQMDPNDIMMDLQATLCNLEMASQASKQTPNDNTYNV